MKMLLLIWFGKFLSAVSKLLGLGAGSTWPGHLALLFEPKIIEELSLQIKLGIVLVAGTNGKTTTASMIRTIIGGRIISNESGANLLNGIASALIKSCDWSGKIRADWAVFEVDEATLPLAISKLPFVPQGKQTSSSNKKRLIIVLLNLFRDQLDRYGEVDIIADKWLKGLKELRKETTVVLNADDPHLAFLGQNLKAEVIYFGLSDVNLYVSKMEHAVDSVYCPRCGTRLNYEGIYYSHLGVWECSSCGLSRPVLSLSSWDYPLPGVYNRYNTLAAVLVAKSVGVSDNKIRETLTNFKPAFGRQEDVNVNGKIIKLLLSKNPAGFNESLRVLNEFPGEKKNILLVLNDRIPDGRDVSWIWDVDFEMIPESYNVLISGDRAYDMGLRIKYAMGTQKSKVKSQNYNSKLKIYEDFEEAIRCGTELLNKGETLYILPTYSAMLEVRKIIRGRGIL